MQRLDALAVEQPREQAAPLMRPISASGWCTVVSRGVTICASAGVVEADDRHVVWDAQPERSRRLHGAEGELVVEGEYGCWALGDPESNSVAAVRPPSTSKFDSITSCGSGSTPAAASDAW